MTTERGLRQISKMTRLSFHHEIKQQQSARLKQFLKMKIFVCIECFVKRHYDELCESNPDFIARMTANHFKIIRLLSKKLMHNSWTLTLAKAKTGTGKTTSNARTVDDTFHTPDNNSLRRFCRLPQIRPQKLPSLD